MVLQLLDRREQARKSTYSIHHTADVGINLLLSVALQQGISRVAVHQFHTVSVYVVTQSARNASLFRKSCHVLGMKPSPWLARMTEYTYEQLRMHQARWWLH